MFPIRNSIPTTQTPVAVYTIIAVNTLVFLYQITLPPPAAVDFAYSYGLVPYVYFDGYSGSAAWPRLSRIIFRSSPPPSCMGAGCTSFSTCGRC